MSDPEGPGQQRGVREQRRPGEHVQDRGPGPDGLGAHGERALDQVEQLIPAT